MIKSMTAFSRVEKTEGELAVSAEIRSYNSRYLDTVLRIPQAYLSMEERIKGLISEKVARGRIELRLQIKDESEDACVFEINRVRASAYHGALVQLKNMLNIDTEISLNMLAGHGGIIKPAETERDTEKHWSVIAGCVTDAVSELDAMRKKEGDFIARDFVERLDFIEKAMGQIEKESGSLLLHYQERLKERIDALTKGITEIDPPRIAQEAAFLADRSDISEEIVRVKSHIQQFRAFMDSEESSGRKLNFLLQEFNREFNTMGSKAGNVEASYTIVNIKSELEKIREQVQNVE
ncbi:YicC/YloC family endoribonuclease [Desulfobacterales bacterium HSG2]|nr:YicC/YloC family endoribonuclease [Desulfobacterales bacterium HSG2]